jgi:hypothetical protein
MELLVTKFRMFSEIFLFDKYLGRQITWKLHLQVRVLEE